MDTSQKDSTTERFICPGADCGPVCKGCPHNEPHAWDSTPKRTGNGCDGYCGGEAITCIPAPVAEPARVVLAIAGPARETLGLFSLYVRERGNVSIAEVR